MITFENEGTSAERATRIKVLGVGGAGGNAVKRMVSYGIKGIDFHALNTDMQVLKDLPVPNKHVLGRETTRGLGAGAKPEVGEKAALECRAEIEEILRDTDMVFITAGMGKGTGTGASPIIAEIAKAMNVLVVGVVTTPFNFEGDAKKGIASKGIEKLVRNVDTLITIPNQNLLKICDRKTSMAEAFQMSDDILRQAVQGVSDIITCVGEVNVDFNDVKTIMENKGPALMGLGTGHGESRGLEAVERAINSPLLDSVSIKNAKGVVINITGGEDLSLYEVDEIAGLVRREAAPNAMIIFGHVKDDKMQDEVRVTVLATGFDLKPAEETKTAVKEEKYVFKVYTQADISIPTYQRKKAAEAKAPETAVSVAPVRDEDIDIPTFLRKRSV
jgi:cell division protein FtsZ